MLLPGRNHRVLGVRKPSAGQHPQVGREAHLGGRHGEPHGGRTRVCSVPGKVGNSGSFYQVKLQVTVLLERLERMASLRAVVHVFRSVLGESESFGCVEQLGVPTAGVRDEACGILCTHMRTRLGDLSIQGDADQLWILTRSRRQHGESDDGRTRDYRLAIRERRSCSFRCPYGSVLDTSFGEHLLWRQADPRGFQKEPHNESIQLNLSQIC